MFAFLLLFPTLFFVLYAANSVLAPIVLGASSSVGEYALISCVVAAFVIFAAYGAIRKLAQASRVIRLLLLAPSFVGIGVTTYQFESAIRWVFLGCALYAVLVAYHQLADEA